MNEVMNTILHRRSIRRFEPKQIEEPALQQIIQAGLYAPSAGGRQSIDNGFHLLHLLIVKNIYAPFLLFGLIRLAPRPQGIQNGLQALAKFGQ